jgi:hypothetical protein
MRSENPVIRDPSAPAAVVRLSSSLIVRFGSPLCAGLALPWTIHTVLKGPVTGLVASPNFFFFAETSKPVANLTSWAASQSNLGPGIADHQLFENEVLLIRRAIGREIEDTLGL